MGQRCRFGLACTGMAALHHPKLLIWSEPRDTNPIGRARFSGLAQSGFNEVAHSARPDPQRRATSQNPPDSQEGEYLIQGGFWGGWLDQGFDERRGMGLP